MNAYHNFKFGTREDENSTGQGGFAKAKDSNKPSSFTRVKMSLHLMYLLKENMLLTVLLELLKMNMIDPNKLINKMNILKGHLLMLIKKRKGKKLWRMIMRHFLWV